MVEEPNESRPSDTGDGPPKRRRRRKPVRSTDDEAPAPPPPPPQEEEEPKKPRRVKKRRKSKSDPDPTPIVSALRDLAEDVQNSPIRTKPDTPRSISYTTGKRVQPDILYVEGPNKFVAVRRDKLIPRVDKEEQEVKKSDPVTFALWTQKCFFRLTNWSAGVLAGIAIWHCIIVYMSGPDWRRYADLSRPLHSLFYILTTFCVVSALDRRKQSFGVIQSGSVLLLVYVCTLGLTLATSRLDDRLVIAASNSTWSDEDLPEIGLWKDLNLSRCVAAVLGWILLSMKPGTDYLYKHVATFKEVN